MIRLYIFIIKTCSHTEKFHTVGSFLFMAFNYLQTDIKYCTSKELFKIKCVISSSFLHMFFVIKEKDCHG